jgi:hypothetical protein
MRLIFVPFDQSVIAVRLQNGLFVCDLIALGVTPSTRRTRLRVASAWQAAPWLQLSADVFVAASLCRGAPSVIPRARRHNAVATACYPFVGSLWMYSCLFVVKERNLRVGLTI